MAVTTRKTPIKYRRGKSLPAIKHGDILDWTSFPLHSKPNGRAIEMCPKCGRKGEMTRHRSRDPKEPFSGTEFTHTSQFQTMFWFVRESCHIAPEPVEATA